MGGGKCSRTLPPSSKDRTCTAYHEKIDSIIERFKNDQRKLTPKERDLAFKLFEWNHTSIHGRGVAHPETLLIGLLPIN